VLVDVWVCWILSARYPLILSSCGAFQGDTNPFLAFAEEDDGLSQSLTLSYVSATENGASLPSPPGPTDDGVVASDGEQGELSLLLGCEALCCFVCAPVSNRPCAPLFRHVLTVSAGAAAN
jgi:hypothetical protein